jgi:hypothetical protein
MRSVSEHHWVVDCSVGTADPAVSIELQLIAPGEDVLAAGKGALGTLAALGVDIDLVRITDVNPHYFQDMDSGGAR